MLLGLLAVFSVDVKYTDFSKKVNFSTDAFISRS